MNVSAFAVLLALASCAPSPGATAQGATPPAQTYEQDPNALPQELRNGALRAAASAEIRAAVERFGAHAVVFSLHGERSDQGWDRVSAGVASGEQEWLDLVPILRPGTDGAVSEDLSISISDALQYNARGVLRLIGGRESVEMVCRFGHIEPSESEVAAFYAAAIPSVEAVDEPDLRNLKRECLAALERDRDQFAARNR